MKSTLVLLLTLAAAFGAASASAEHNPGYPGNPGYPAPGGSAVQQLYSEASRLNSQVQYSYLNTNVKVTVSRFANEVASLANGCRPWGVAVESANDGSIDVEDHGNPSYPPYPGGSCAYQRDRVLQSWSQVERYLYDTYYDFPAVYDQYLRTRSAVYAIRAGW